MLKVSLAQKIESEFKYCQSKEISRIASPFLNCNHPNEINHHREKAHIDLKIEFPSNIYILSRNKFFASQIGYQCFKTRIITRSSWRYMIFRTRDVKKETIKMSRLECLMMAESKKCNDNLMSCTDEGCSYTPAQVDEYTWFYDQKSESFECTMRKRKITSEKPDTQLFASASSSCKYNDLYCNLYDSVVAWENTGEYNHKRMPNQQNPLRHKLHNRNSKERRHLGKKKYHLLIKRRPFISNNRYHQRMRR